jgi:hypothetical protein
VGDPFFQVLQTAYHLGLAVIVGGGLALGGAAAPAIFRTVRSRAEAGTIFGAVLARYDGVAVFAVIVVWAATFLRAVNFEIPDLVHQVRWVALGLMGIATLYASAWSNPVARSIRQQTQRFDELPLEHPSRREFSLLHARSTRAMSLAILLGVIALFLS